MIEKGKVAYARVDGTRLDTGEPGGFFEAQLYNAMQEPALKSVLARFVAEHGAELGLGGSRPDRK
jgi:UTP-glucose-1-phosphate uridylyltransferase